MKNYFLGILLAATIGVFGCTAATMKTWLGSSGSKVLASWGAPDRTAKTADGRTIYTWNGRNAHGEIICTMTFVVSANDVIESYSTNCR